MKSRRAFTLIELLVVVAIIALLIALLLPTLARAKEEGKTTKCLANMHELSIALATYNSQNKDLMPSVQPAMTGPTWLTDWYGTAGPAQLMGWADQVYVDGDFQENTDWKGKGGVNGDGSGANNNYSWHYPTWGYGIMSCPKHDPQYQQDSSGQPSDDRYMRAYSLAWCANSHFYDATTPFSVEARNLNPGHIMLSEGNGSFGIQGSYPVPAHMDKTASPSYFRYGLFERHPRMNTLGACYLFADSHAEWSSQYGWAPSPIDFKSDIRWKTYVYKGPTVLPNGSANTMISNHIWSHGASEY